MELENIVANTVYLKAREGMCGMCSLSTVTVYNIFISPIQYSTYYTYFKLTDANSDISNMPVMLCIWLKKVLNC